MSVKCPGNEDPQYRLDRTSESPEFSHFVAPWLDRAQRGSDPFDRLIHLWVAFNAWLAEVVDPIESERVRDRALINAAARDDVLAARFDALMQGDPTFRKRTEEFHSLWPVFDVRRLAKLHVSSWEDSRENRAEYRGKCFAAGVPERDYEPHCFRDHQQQLETSSDELQRIHLDWPHALAAIYQVRCNLFHGGKAFQMRSDHLFSELAFEILWAVWGGGFSAHRGGEDARLGRGVGDA